MEDIVEVIKEGEIVRMYESQAVQEDLFILRRIMQPEKEPVQDPQTAEKQALTEKAIRNYAPLQHWRNRKEEYQKNHVLKSLVDNFQWEITRARREKGLSRRQLADAVDVSEDIMKIIETGGLPTDDFVIISKIENVLGIRLRKEQPQRDVNLMDLQKNAEERAKQIREQAPEKKEEPKDVAGSDIEIIGD